jgi:hypothetical protein
VRSQIRIAGSNRDQILKQQKSVKSLISVGHCQNCGAAWGRVRSSYKLFGKAVYCDECWQPWRPIAEAGLAHEIARQVCKEVLKASR